MGIVSGLKCPVIGHLFFWFKFCNHVYEKRLVDWPIQS